MTLIDQIQQVLGNLGLNALGLASPALALRWAAGADPVEGGPESLSLSVSGAEWIAPAAGVLSFTAQLENLLVPPAAPALPRDTPRGLDVANRLRRPDGSPLVTSDDDQVAVLTLDPQVYLRLVRLYAALLEGRQDDQPRRPVPHAFAYQGVAAVGSPDAVAIGVVRANQQLGIGGGTLTMYDVHGLAIDPTAVASAFLAFVTRFGALEARDSLNQAASDVSASQLSHIAGLGAAGRHVHLVDPHGAPVSATSDFQPRQAGTILSFDTLSSDATAVGLFGLPNSATSIDKASGDARANMRVGSATNGTLADSFALPTVPQASGTLHRDFFRVCLVDLKPFLVGDLTTGPAPNVEPPPAIRHDESVDFVFDGNAVLGAANAILANQPQDALVAAPDFDDDFDLPTDATAANAEWPNFPARLVTPPADPANDPANAAIPFAVRDQLQASARFVDNRAADGTAADVVLTLNGLTPDLAVRVYNRVFLPDAREGRGDGAGAIVQAGGTVEILLRDPLGLVEPGFPLPQLSANDTLHVDLVLVNRANQARVFGNVTASIALNGQLPALSAVTNRFVQTTDRGIAPADIIGLAAPPLPPPTLDSLQGVVDFILDLGGEGDPRQAPTLPTMARREAIVASGNNGTWRAELSGAQLSRAARNAQQRKGSPGSPGGPEFQTVAVQTEGGRLAYDLSRAALRRTRHVVARLPQLALDRWAEPPAATAGTISSTVLQTVAPMCETPELALAAPLLTNLPATFADFVDRVRNDPAMPAAIGTALGNLRNSAAGTRLYDEIRRDFSASVHGRRDAQRALRRAIGAARELVYIEGPAFSPTGYGADDAEPATESLVKVLARRLDEVPGLRVILCLSKELDYGPGYEPIAARELAERKTSIDALLASKRVVAFHPIGFPGRPLRLMTCIVDVDDVWAMFGSSAFRRRGMTYDGGLDVALFDRQLREGRGQAIVNLRRRLMAGHLGIAEPAAGSLPGSTWVRLEDAQSAFGAVQELLDQGGAGVIEPLFDGHVAGVPQIPASSFPSDDLADPRGSDFAAGNPQGAIIALTGILSLLAAADNPALASGQPGFARERVGDVAAE
ncbi:MAG TPA: hypothetical protein VGJ60_03145 [Chloroflexota bacterium]|jgi:hypothetical protein